MRELQCVMNKDLTTLFTGRSSILVNEVDSTNSFMARTLKDEKLPEGAVIRALRQNAGRGQSGSQWESENGKNLLLSFVFYPTFISPREVFLLNKTFTLAVHDFVKFWTNEVIKIKWPNDIYWNELKVAGILIENSINSTTISHSVLGIGINVNQKKFSPSIPNAVSLSFITGKEFTIDELFESLCSFLEVRYLQLKNGDRKGIDTNYNRALFAINEWRQFRTPEKTFRGRILAVDENGRLVIEGPDNDVYFFNAKEVAFLFNRD
jgi:BirA family biotin operon repressor/biotin-[acetyl-CoA-carboxylase] ligase